MALTKHQEFHLDAVIAEVDSNLLESTSIQEKLAVSKGVLKESYNTYLDKVKSDAQAILDSGIFPLLEHPSDIHDFLEK